MAAEAARSLALRLDGLDLVLSWCPGGRGGGGEEWERSQA